MNYCPQCGNQLSPNAKFCPACGYTINPVDSSPEPIQAYPNDTGSILWGVLGFFIPVVGLILFLVWRTDAPNNARVAGKGALISVIVEISLYLLLILFLMVLSILGLFVNEY